MDETIELILTGCGNEIDSGNGSIFSPSFPDNYPLNAVCKWTFKLTAIDVLHLHFRVYQLAEMHTLIVSGENGSSHPPSG